MKNSQTEAKYILQKLRSNISNDSISGFAKVILATSLFDFFEILQRSNYPEKWTDMLGNHLEHTYNAMDFISNKLEIVDKEINTINSNKPYEGLALQTGEVYSQLFEKFDKKEYYNKTKVMLQERINKNNLKIDNLNKALDAGCGGGRYSLALKSMGIKKLIGIDISENSINFANKMNIYKKDVNFIQSSVLELPFDDDSFDFVFSNGVLHHTSDTQKGLNEIRRVLKKNGKCWLYLYGGKESFFWDIVDFCRSILKNISQNYTSSAMQMLGYNSGRIFHRNDFFYVPRHHRYFKEEVDDMLQSAGFKNYSKLDRGFIHDWDEIIYNFPNIDNYIFGEGEMRYWIEK